MRPRSRPSSLLEASKSVRSRYFRKAMASFQAVPYERTQVTYGFLWTRCLARSHITRCCLFFPMPRFASTPYGSLPPQWRLLSLTSDERCCRTPPIACRQLDHKSSVLSLPFGRRVGGFNSDWCLANRTVALGPCVCTAEPYQGPHAPITYSTALSTTPQTRPKGIDRGGNARNRALL